MDLLIVVASIPYIIICVVLTLYIVVGALTFSTIDNFMEKNSFTTKCFFIFTTLTTIGYGDLAPKNSLSKVFCLFYVGAGVPLLLLALTNFGQLLAELFWAVMLSFSANIHVDPESRRKLPISVVTVLLLLHSLIGAAIFSYWIDDLPFVAAIYFSFVSITTIGFGDVTVVPKNNFDIAILVTYLFIGIVIMTMFVNAVVDYVQWIHYLYRRPTSFRKNGIWFGGESMTVQELVQLWASSFEISPRQLRKTIRNLDHIIAVALQDELRKKSGILSKNSVFLNYNSPAKEESKVIFVCAVSFLYIRPSNMDQEIKISTIDTIANQKGIAFLVGTIFGSIFALVNCIFAFYNLFQIAVMVVRTLEGMTMKINLAEKALKERQLPLNLMARLRDARSIKEN